MLVLVLVDGRFPVVLLYDVEQEMLSTLLSEVVYWSVQPEVSLLAELPLLAAESLLDEEYEVPA